MRIKAFTLIEMTVVLAILGVIASTVLVNQLEQMKVRVVQLTAAEISELQQAAVLYYVNHNNTWPGSVSDLKTAGYVPSAWNGLSKLGTNYMFNGTVRNFTVSTVLPAGYAGYDYILNQSLAGYPGAINGMANSTIPVPGDATVVKAAVPQHEIILWQNDTCPQGFTKITDPALNGQFLVAGQSYNPVAGGSLTHTHGPGSYLTQGYSGTSDGHALTIAEMPSHSHTVWNGQLYQGALGGAGSNLVLPSSSTNTGVTGGNQAHSHTFSVPALALSGTSGINATDSRPPFATVVLCEKQ